VDHWVSYVLKRFGVMSPWEKRALIVASYTLGDEGRYWRDGIKHQLSSVDRKLIEWIGPKNSGRRWEIPL
jgi:hypothetical protein